FKNGKTVSSRSRNARIALRFPGQKIHTFQRVRCMSRWRLLVYGEQACGAPANRRNAILEAVAAALQKKAYSRGVFPPHAAGQLAGLQGLDGQQTLHGLARMLCPSPHPDP